MAELNEFVDVKTRARELGCQEPSRLCLLPRNFATAGSASDLVMESTAPTVRLLMREKGVLETPLEKPGTRFNLKIENAFDWIAPTIYFASELIQEQPGAVKVMIDMIKDYLFEQFKGLPRSEVRAKLRVVTESADGGYKEIAYEGPVEGLDEVVTIVTEVHNERSDRKLS